MRWVLVLFVSIAITSVAGADVELATDTAAVPPAKLAGGCAEYTPLVGHDPKALARVMDQRGLTPVTLELLEVPDSAVGSASAWTIVTLRLGKRRVRGILGRVVGCMKPNNRHAVDADGKIYHFDGPAGVVDQDTQRCHTPAGWKACRVVGQRFVLWVVKDPKAQLAGQFGSDLESFYPAR